MTGELPASVMAVISAYDPATGCYRREDGSLDPCHTEIETLQTWGGLIRCIKPKVVVETGVYLGLSTSYIAAALRDSHVEGAKVYSIDPMDTPHYWDGSDLEGYIEFLPYTSQAAAPKLAHLAIDVLVIDSMHTYDQSSWELMTFEPQIRSGGFIIMHDTLFFDGVGRSAQHLYDNPRFEVITFDTPRTASAPTMQEPVSMGCTIARKIRCGSPITRDPAWLRVPETAPAGPLALIRDRTLERSGA
jgi:predicted O-methyltransferase YrrM